ncbi:MAG: GDSL-type esterase/lipase family protein, partial [Bacteroidota bacterium]
ISAQYDHRQSLYQQLMRPTGGIVFLGDSITEGGAWSELLNEQNVRNRGIAGDVSSSLLRRLPTVLGLSPNKLFLMIGINDLLFVSVEEVVTNYKAIVQQIRSTLPDCQLYLQSVLPVNNEVRNIPIDNAEVRRLNAAIRQIAADNQLPYLDIHSLLVDDTGQLSADYTIDGIHINGAAYAKWSESLKGYLSVE